MLIYIIMSGLCSCRSGTATRTFDQVNANDVLDKVDVSKFDDKLTLILFYRGEDDQSRFVIDVLMLGGSERDREQLAIRLRTSTALSPERVFVLTCQDGSVAHVIRKSNHENISTISVRKSPSYTLRIGEKNIDAHRLFVAATCENSKVVSVKMMKSFAGDSFLCNDLWSE